MSIIPKSQRCPSYVLQDKKSTLICEGALDHDIWDRMSAASPAEYRDQFVKTLFDPRLNKEEVTPALFGPAWKEMEGSSDSLKKLILTSPNQGVQQILSISINGDSGNEFSVKSVVSGVVEHEMSGQYTFTSLNQDCIQETVTPLTSPTA